MFEIRKYNDADKQTDEKLLKELAETYKDSAQ